MSMIPPMSDTSEAWNEASAAYDEKIAPVTAQYADAMIERLELDRSLRVLEVAAGSGALTEALYPRVGSLLATDFSPGMLERLKARLSSRGVTNVEYAVMDGQALEVDDASFDRAVCNFGLMLFPDRSRGFAELRRCLRPGGRAVVSGWAGPDRFEAFGTLLASIRRAVPDLPPPPGPPPIFSLADPAAFAAEMEAAGFRDARIDLVGRDVEVESAGQLWEMLTMGAPPVRALFERIGEAAVAKVRTAMREILAERFGNGPIRLRNVATIGTGLV